MPSSTMVERPEPTLPLSPAHLRHSADPPLPEGLAGDAGRSTRGGRRGPALAMLAGMVLFIAAGVAWAQLIGTDTGGSATPAAAVAVAAPAPAPPAPSGFTLSPGDISVVTHVYGPGEDSGWHSHSGLHAITILSGALSVYDAECRVEQFGPGRPYIGGQQLHLAVNLTTAPVEMVTTYVSPSATENVTHNSGPPTGCRVDR